VFEFMTLVSKCDRTIGEALRGQRLTKRILLFNT